MGLGWIDAYESAIFCFGCDPLKISSSKGKEVRRHPWSRSKFPNACFFAVLHIDFRHIWKGNFTFFLVKFQRKIKRCFGFRLVHTWKGFTRKMALKLSWKDFLLHTINAVVRWVNPSHIVSDLTRIGQSNCHLTCAFQFNINCFIGIINRKWTGLTGYFYCFNGQIFLVKRDLVRLGLTCDHHTTAKGLSFTT